MFTLINALSTEWSHLWKNAGVHQHLCRCFKGSWNGFGCFNILSIWTLDIAFITEIFRIRKIAISIKWDTAQILFSLQFPKNNDCQNIPVALWAMKLCLYIKFQ